MSRTQYNQVPDPIVEGQTFGPRESKPFGLPFLAQETNIELADGSPAAGESWVLSATDDENGFVYSVPFLSGASLAVSLDNAIAAIALDGKFTSLFTATEDGSTDLDLVSRHPGKSWTIALDTGAGSATAAITNTVDPGGAKLQFGRLLARSAEDEARELAAGDTLRSLAGVLFRTDFNHVRPYEPADQRATFDGMARGKTASLMIRGQIAMLPQVAPSALGDSVFMRIDGGNVGQIRATADGGNTVDISSIARWESLANADGLCRVRFDML